MHIPRMNVALAALLGMTLTAALLPGVAAAQAETTPTQQPMNVLFIAIDDLRPELGCYGDEQMVTPNIDRLARQGRLFNRHYVQVPMCGPSRYAMLASQLPTPEQPKSYAHAAFDLLPDVEPDRAISLPHLFKRNGYTTVSLGKISHNPDGRKGDGSLEVPFSWDEAYVPTGEWDSAWDAFFAYAGGKTRDPGKTPATEAADVPDTGYPDGLIAEEAVRKLGELKDEPFFLAVGFFKPHLPFNAPKKYWDLYDPQEIELAGNPFPPKNVDPKISLHTSWELTPRYTGLETPGTVTEGEARHLRHAYYASVSYIDAQVGKVLDELDRLGLSDNTVVVLWGDHGWHLGEHGIWGKHTLFEVAMRSPLIIRTPDAVSPGEASDGIVQSLDIYPTLAELCGLDVPDDLDGESLVPLLRDPEHSGDDMARGYWRANGLLGETMRTDRYRITRWTDPKTSQVAQIELYDHRVDPEENVNIADRHPDVVKRLLERLETPSDAAATLNESE